MSRKWDDRFMAIAVQVSQWSKDPNKKVGCVIVSPDRREIVYGYNGFPRQIADDERLDNRDIKNEIMVHAEVNALLNAKRDLENWALFVTSHPCVNCACAIIQAGIDEVVVPPISASSNWYEQHKKAEALLKEAGVSVVTYPGSTEPPEPETVTVTTHMRFPYELHRLLDDLEHASGYLAEFDTQGAQDWVIKCHDTLTKLREEWDDKFKS